MLIFGFPKIALHHKTINKTQSTKNPKKSTNRFGDNYLLIHLVKFLQDRIKPEELELLEYALGITFLNKSR